MHNRSNDQLLFIQGKILANTVPLAGREGQVGIRVSTFCVAGMETKRVMLFRILPYIRVLVDYIDCHINGHSSRNEVTIKLNVRLGSATEKEHRRV